MGFHRRNTRGPMSRMVTQRTGGRVTLFNYNPSIAGGTIAVNRYKTAHYRGRFMRHKEHEHTVASTGTGGGLGVGVSGRGAEGNYQGVGATGRTAMHSMSENKRKLHELIANKMMSGSAAKRMRV